MKKPTTVDVARMAGVSQSTVSFVLNDSKDVSISDETRQKVLEAMEKLNYVPRKNLKTAKADTQKLIALIIPTISNPFYHILTQSIEAYAESKGYKTIVCNTSRNIDTENYYLNILPDKGIAGIIYEFTPHNHDLVHRISEKLPVIIIGEKSDDLNIDTISLNSFKAGELLVQHLVELGHKKMAYLSSPLFTTSMSRKKRLDGIMSKLKEYKLDKNLIIQVAPDEYESYESTYEIEIGRDMTKKLLKEHDVTAIIGVNDMLAMGVMSAISSAGLKVPQNISVCGFDNIFLSKMFSPGLTTIDHCTEHRSKLAVDILVDKMKHAGNQNVLKIEYEPQLIIRESTAAL